MSGRPRTTMNSVEPWASLLSFGSLVTSDFAIFQAWGNACHERVAALEFGTAALKLSVYGWLDVAGISVDGGHIHKGV